MKYFITCSLVLLLFSCGNEKKQAQTDYTEASWETITKDAKGQTLTMIMWIGDSKINAYMKGFVKPMVKKNYDINLEIVGGQGGQIIQMLMTELQANAETSNVDMLWINGETFYQLRQLDGLYGPWTSKLPNSKYIDFNNPFIGMDFQQPIEGYELPWGNVQMAMIYDSAKVENPPMTREGLLAFVKANPGKFTFDNQFTGLTFLKALLIDIAGGDDVLKGDFDEAKYHKYSQELWTYINELKPYLWRQGEVFPESVAQMHQLFASGELWFSMSNNDAEVDSKTSEGLFPETARAYVPDFGTIQNSHYLGITKLSGVKPAAMLVANFMVSPEAQLEKMRPTVWGDGTVLDMETLSEDMKAKFQNLPSRKRAPKRSEIQQKAHLELAPEYMIRLSEDFRKEIIEK
ncbi:ABC transporter substrate-binding protein [Subsaximicrobium wynnwilliamsii]|uniref:ABC transporter substrate-binding protein n=1 Tax=Subsaximicrobium wynnwilliamsii TaxID=291179 RepID=A0A5C6ZGX7_9FLAO|nr:ABC transporter substrate-binding protein [Subsaximicrobium wynnwilliamsii]TXD83510.1 ABC transporter substrate-binding protein [Subsaximicrobium wynnwilliamsii]TXD89215.1 ABC transporter substrate-binding protein [Subsaximicrobium wynnwilliamsii]TXE03190.1 ABC transporter substrate-binding protein [Subsaximicrobium wynnwilliamsii]